MKTLQEWRTIDKSAWGEGPWREEPDKVQLLDERTDLDCLIVRSPTFGGLCGYVGVGPSHPLHGRGYDELNLAVHGGLTFASGCDEHAPEGKGICHVPLEGRPADVWWFGFDCGHGDDVQPGMVAWEKGHGFPHPMFERTYRDLAYVVGQLELLAAQLRALA